MLFLWKELAYSDLGIYWRSFPDSWKTRRPCGDGRQAWYRDTVLIFYRLPCILIWSIAMKTHIWMEIREMRIVSKLKFFQLHLLQIVISAFNKLQSNPECWCWSSSSLWRHLGERVEGARLHCSQKRRSGRWWIKTKIHNIDQNAIKGMTILARHNLDMERLLRSSKPTKLLWSRCWMWVLRVEENNPMKWTWFVELNKNCTTGPRQGRWEIAPI